MELKKLNAQIKSIATKTSKWRDEVQFCLIGCAEFAFDHSNVDPATRLVHAVKGSDMTALIHWMEKHMPVIWVRADDKFRYNKSFKGEFDGLALAAEPWWELAKEPREVQSSVDCLDMVRGLIKRINKEIEAGKKTVAHADLIAQLSAVANDYEFKLAEAE